MVEKLISILISIFMLMLIIPMTYMITMGFFDFVKEMFDIIRRRESWKNTLFAVYWLLAGIILAAALFLGIIYLFITWRI